MPLDSQTFDPLGEAEYALATPAPLFVFSASPHRYELHTVDGKAVLLPLLSKHTIASGYHGIAPPAGESYDAQRDSAAFRERLRSRGEHILDAGAQIPKNVLPDWQSPGGYLRRVMVRPSKGAEPVASYLDAWTRLLPGRRRDMPYDQVFDREGFNAWRLYLAFSGAVPAASLELRERLVREAQAKVERLQATSFADPEIRRQRVEAALAELDRVTTVCFPPTPPSDKPARRVKPAAAVEAA